MLDAWHDFYLLTGSAAAALIGLLFVVTTLTAGRDRSTVRRGMRLYTSPVVFHLALILLLSGAAMAPPLPAKAFGWLCGACGAIGAVAGTRIAIGIHRIPSDGETAGWFDIWWYGILPALLYLLLAGCAAAIVANCPWGVAGVGACLMALLLSAIHNAWDLVTWLAPAASDITDRTQNPG